MVTRSTPRWTLAVLLAGLCGLFSVFAKGHVDNLDAVQTVYAARSMWYRGDLGLPETEDAHSLIGERLIRSATPPMGMRGSNGAHYVWFPVGHQLLLVPAVAAGEALAGQLPEVERRLLAIEGPGYGDLFWVMFCASFVPTLCAGACVWVLFQLVLALGLSGRAALACALIVGIGTQFWPMMVENLSDGPGQLFLFAAVLQVVRWFGRDCLAKPATLFWGGTWAGLAVCMRYPHALSVAVLGLFVAGAAWHRLRDGRAWLRALLAFSAGGAPWAVLLLAANYLRFGDVAETGYGAADLGQWFNYPLWLGALMQFGAFGKGMLWLSPLLWPALWWGLRRPGSTAPDSPGSRSPAEEAAADPAASGALQVLFWSLFVVPLLLFSCTDGWQAGECWGVRYVAPGMFLLVAWALARRRPWCGSWVPRCALVVFAGWGIWASATGLAAPVRGYLNLAAPATQAAYRARGVELSQAALPLHMFVDWQFSPLHGNWTYAALNASGRMQQRGSAHTTEPIFGVATKFKRLPVRHADTGFRHFWWVWLGDVAGWTVWPAAAALGLLSVLAIGWTWRRLGPATEGPTAAQVPGAMGR